MRERRFLVENLEATPLTLTGRERRHAVDVLRLSVGAEVALFDGRGAQALAGVVAITADEVRLELRTSPERIRSSPIALTLAVAAPKGSRGDWLVEKCAELGVPRLVLIDTQRSEVQPREAKLDRWRRKAVEAAKQSGAASVMRIESGRSIAEVLAGVSAEGCVVYGATSGDAPSLHTLLDDLDRVAGGEKDVLCVVGPEGGLTEAELGLLASRGARAMTLGAPTLRVETAAIAAAAVWAGFSAGGA
ncbi:MAG TPA: RsmE family RNA methyltransferase [Phycisphaerae bacterium]|nr:RsmE family RNA methyltransferase [Phycisphaerae bacterium]HRW55018.1 RsmE family RNA methyltransferase [Phycisphaerae bacterium]